MLGGKDDLLKESVILFAAGMKEDLAGPKASRLEKVAAERVAACWVEVEYHRAWLVQRPEADGTKVGQLHEKRFEAAHRRMERAMSTLATIRKLLPRTIEVQLVQKPSVAPPMESIIGNRANNDQPKVNDPQMAPQSQKVPANGMAVPVNRINGVGKNGHPDRFGGILTPATAE
jgi:hypothetical protein